MVWATFWAIFSQTHLVTLAAEDEQDELSVLLRNRGEVHRMLKINFQKVRQLNQGCQMVYLQTKYPYLGIFWRALEWKVLLHFMAIWDIQYGHFEFLAPIW
jgi:hypothetical protein